MFQRQGDDIYLDLPITFTEAALGTKKQIPTIAKEAFLLTIPEGSQPGKMLRVKGQGFRNVHGNGLGDLIVRINIETPVNLSSSQKKLFTDLGETIVSSNSPNTKSFFEKLKSFLK